MKKVLGIALSVFQISPLGSLVRHAGKEFDMGQARNALYRVYNIFEKIHSRLKHEKRSDMEVARKLLSGQMLAKDRRFDEARLLAQRQKGHEAADPIPLSDKDSIGESSSLFFKLVAAPGFEPATSLLAGNRHLR